MEKNNDLQPFEELDDLHNEELEDIVLEKYEKKDKIKKWLLVAGSVILIFVIVISIVKVISDSSSAPQDALVENETSTISEEASSQSSLEEVPIVPEESAPEDEFNKVIQEVMQKEKALKQAANEATKSPNEPSPKRTTQPQQASTASVSTQRPTPKKIANKPKPTPPKPTQKTKKTATKSGNVYIQVGAFLKYDPDKKFLQKIKKAGFDYIVKTFHINGKRIKRVYIGPFTDRKEASRYLAKIKKRINPNAFITKVK